MIQRLFDGRELPSPGAAPARFLSPAPSPGARTPLFAADAQAPLDRALQEMQAGGDALNRAAAPAAAAPAPAEKKRKADDIKVGGVVYKKKVTISWVQEQQEQRAPAAGARLKEQRCG